MKVHLSYLNFVVKGCEYLFLVMFVCTFAAEFRSIEKKSSSETSSINAIALLLYCNIFRDTRIRNLVQNLNTEVYINQKTKYLNILFRSGSKKI